MKAKLLPFFKKSFLNLLCVLLSLVVGLIIVEVILRFTPYSQLSTNYSYPPGYFIADNELGYDIQKNVPPTTHGFREHPYPIFSNSLGCFDWERTLPDHYTLVVGDSFAWGYTPLEKKWTTLLEQQTGKFILKCGVTGYGTKQELIKAKRVINQAKKKPATIILLYSYNDLNDDFLFPHRTVYGDGYLVSTRGKSDLMTGKSEYMSDAQMKAKYAKFVSGSFPSKVRQWTLSTVTFRLWTMAKPAVRAWKHRMKEQLGIISPTAAHPPSTMPQSMTGAYGTDLNHYFDTTNRPWFNRLINHHTQTIIEFAEYARSLNAKFVIIDIDGTLTHPRFEKFQSYFYSNNQAYYRNLRQDLPVQSTWKYDKHWGIQGNKEVADAVSHYLKTIHYFDSKQ